MRTLLVSFLLILLSTISNEAMGQFFKIPEVDLSDFDPTNPNSGVSKSTRKMDKIRLHYMSNDPRPGRDYTKIYLKNNTNETITAAIRVIPFEMSDNASTLAESVTNSPWRTQLWYRLTPGQRVHVVNTNNAVMYTYAKSEGGKEWRGSHAVNLGNANRPNYVQFAEKRIIRDIPEEWTFDFAARNDDERIEIKYTIRNTTNSDIKFRLPSGKVYSLKPGETESYHNHGTADNLKIHVFATGRDYVLTDGNHKFFWSKSKNRIGFDLQYDQE